MEQFPVDFSDLILADNTNGRLLKTDASVGGM